MDTPAGTKRHLGPAMGLDTDFRPWSRGDHIAYLCTKEVHMSREKDVSSHRSLWLMLLVAIAAGVFAFWFTHGRES